MHIKLSSTSKLKRRGKDTYFRWPLSQITISLVRTIKCNSQKRKLLLIQADGIDKGKYGPDE